MINTITTKAKYYIKNTLIPNLYNGFHPYILRAPALATVAASLLLVQVVFNIQSPNSQVLGVSHSIDTQEIVEITNRHRSSEGAGTLSIDRQLQQAAESKLNDMLEVGYWDHYSPDGVAPWEFIVDSGYKYRYVGENLARGFTSSEAIVKGWMASESHRQNMLDNRYDDIGVAFGRGYIDGREYNVVVAMYGSKQPVAVEFSSPTIETEEVLAAERFNTSSDPLTSLAVVPISSQIALFVANGLATIYVAQHVVVARRKIKWDQKSHPRPLLKAVVIVSIALILIYSAQGVVL